MEHRTMGVFLCLYTGYMVITYIRKSVSFASPAMIVAEGMGKSQLGWILSSQMVGYTVGKLLGGVLADMYSPSVIFTISLLSAALTVFGFTLCDTVTMFALCWFVNGLSQGPSWPACALLIKRLFPPETFGTWWSVLSTSMNVSGTAGPILSAFLLTVYSWRVALNVAGSCAFAVAGSATFLLTDWPQGKAHTSHGHNNKDGAKSNIVSWKRGVQDLLQQPVFVAVCFNYLLVSLVRGACTDWGHLYLINDRHHSHLTGSTFTSSQELGGVVGALSAGFLSDLLIAKKVSYYSPRHLGIFFCTTLQSASIFVFISTVSDSSSNLLICLVGFCLGFGMYGSIALFGVVAMESAVDRLAGTAHSVVALAACVGLVLSGYPLSVMAKEYSWHLTFCFVQLLTIVTTIISVFCVRCSTKTTVV